MRVEFRKIDEHNLLIVVHSAYDFRSVFQLFILFEFLYQLKSLLRNFSVSVFYLIDEQQRVDDFTFIVNPLRHFSSVPHPVDIDSVLTVPEILISGIRGYAVVLLNVVNV